MGKSGLKQNSETRSGQPAAGKAPNSLPRGQAPAYRPAIHLILILVVGLLAYSNTFRSPFQWDDTEYIANNPFIRSLDFFIHPSKAETLLDNALISRYVGYLTFALNYKIHGLDVFGYHVVNLAIHIVNALLVYFLVLLTFSTPYFQKRGTATRGLWKKKEGITDFDGSPVADTLSGTNKFFALFVALLFVSHPVQTEAVTYVFQRLASLVGMFYLFSLVMYVKGRQSATRMEHGANPDSQKMKKTMGFATGPMLYYLFSFISAVLAMKTKENAFTLPLVIALYEFLFFSGPLGRRMLRLMPFLLTMLIIPATLAGLTNTAAEVISQVKDPLSVGYERLSRTDYLFTQFRVIVTYIRLLFLPIKQNVDYSYPLSHSFFEPSVILSFVVLMVLFGSAVFLVYRSGPALKGQGSGSAQDSGKNAQPEGAHSQLRADDLPYSPITTHYLRLLGFGILWFFISLSVESSLIPIPVLMAEYRLYLPSAGFFMAVAAAAYVAISSFAFNRGKGKKRSTEGSSPHTPPSLPLTLCALLIVALASATYARNNVWSDKASLWEDVVRKNPSSPRGYNNLGIAYYEKGEYEKAAEMYRHVLSLLPYYRNARVNLGVVYATTGRIGDATEEFNRALSIDPRNSYAYFNLGMAYVSNGQIEKGVEYYRRSIELNPFDGKSYHGLGFAYVKLGRLDNALAAFTRFAELSPHDSEAYRNRGNVYGYKGDFVNAGRDFRKACSMGNVESCNYLRDPRFN